MAGKGTSTDNPARTLPEPTVCLRPITAGEFPAFVAVSKDGYAEDIEVHGGQTREAAQQKAEADFPAVLPLGLATPGHFIFVVEARRAGRQALAGGAAVGRAAGSLRVRHLDRPGPAGARLWTRGDAPRRG
jgi:hypothetical protein